MPEHRDKKKLLGVGLGAGLLGAMLLGLRYALRPATKARVPETISPAIFATKVLHTSLGHVIYHESGSGQPLIFVHGVHLGASSYEWSKVYPHFASRFRVLAPDLIGFGESQRPEAAFGASDYARMLTEFVRATCWQESPPVLIGSGLGGGFCVYLATQHPELLSRLILLMPTGLSDFGRQRLPLGTKLISRTPLLNRFIYRNYRATRGAVRAWLERFAFVNPDRITEENVEVITTCAQQSGAEHAVLNFHAGRFNFDLDTRMRMLSQPATLIWGAQASFPPVEWAYRLQTAVKGCNLVVVEDAGSLAALESPAEITAVLEDQLETGLRVLRAG